MKVIKLGNLFAAKYKIAASAQDLEAVLRKKIPTLWNYPNKLFNILKACAEATVFKAKDPLEQKAATGYRFCRHLLSLIDYLYENKNTISVGEIREKLLQIVKLIEENKDLKISSTGRPSIKGEESTVQFPHVSALIHFLLPINKKHDMEVRKGLQNKARTGLSRILSFSLDMLKDLQELELIAPDKFTYQTTEDIDKETERFAPQRAALSNSDIIDFIRQYGKEYGINSKDDWETIINTDPQLKEDLTTVINARNRGHFASNDWIVRKQIAQILREQEELQQSTTPHFEGPK